MTYAREYPGVAREVQRNVGGTVSVWPKLNGRNVLVATAVASKGAATAVDIPEAPAEAEYSRVDVALSAGDCANYDERVALAVDWTDADGNTGREVVVYDVVRSPLGLLVSLNQLRETRPSLMKVLTRIGQMLVEGTDADPLPPEDVAPIYAAKARVELQDRLRKASRETQRLHVPVGSPANAAAQPRGAGINRLSLVLDRDRFLRIETALAVAHCYEAIAKDRAEGKDEDSANAREWRKAYNDAWNDLGPLAVDEDQDGVTDETLQSPSIGLITTTRG